MLAGSLWVLGAGGGRDITLVLCVHHPSTTQLPLPAPSLPQRRLRALGSESGEAAAKVTLGAEKAAAREEAITLPMNGAWWGGGRREGAGWAAQRTVLGQRWLPLSVSHWRPL